MKTKITISSTSLSLRGRSPWQSVPMRSVGSARSERNRTAHQLEKSPTACTPTAEKKPTPHREEKTLHQGSGHQNGMRLFTGQPPRTRFVGDGLRAVPPDSGYCCTSPSSPPGPLRSNGRVSGPLGPGMRLIRSTAQKRYRHPPVHLPHPHSVGQSWVFAHSAQSHTVAAPPLRAGFPAHSFFQAPETGAILMPPDCRRHPYHVWP